VSATAIEFIASSDRVERALALLDLVEQTEAAKDRAAVARHEAGHAVMAFELGAAVSHVTVRSSPELGFGGHCGIGQWNRALRAVQPDEIASLERTIMILLAGETAERLGGHRHDRAEHDRAAIEEVLRCYPHELHADERDALMAWCTLHTTRRLARAWQAVIAIGMELLLAETLSGDRVRTLYEASLGRPTPFPLPKP